MSNRHPKVVVTLGAKWGLAIAERRKSLGLTQAELAELADVKQQTVSRIEHGTMIPSDRLKVVLAHKLGTTPGALFQWPPTAELVVAA